MGRAGGNHSRAFAPLVPACDTAVFVGAVLFTYLRLASGDLRWVDLSRPFSALPAPLPIALLFALALLGSLVTWRVGFGHLSDDAARTLVAHGLLLGPLGTLLAAHVLTRWPAVAPVLPAFWCTAAAVSLTALARDVSAPGARLQTMDALRISSVTLAVVLLAWSLGAGAAEQRFLDLDVLGACAAAMSMAVAAGFSVATRRPRRLATSGLGYVRHAARRKEATP